MITTKKLAELANVSQSTVSRSLNDSSEISMETKERIVKLAKEHGYMFRKKGRDSAAHPEKVIALILSQQYLYGSPDLYLNALFNSLCSYIDAIGYFSLVLVDSPESNIIERIGSLRDSSNIAGFIIVNQDFNLRINQYLGENSLPHIYIQYFSRAFTKSIEVVDVDHYLGGLIGTQYLIEQGHRRIMTITSYGEDYEERTAGFLAALKKENIQTSKQAVVHCGNDYFDAYQTIREHIDEVKQYSAIFAQCDRMAIGCMNALKDYGVRIPEDISILGYDALEAGNYCRPALSSVAQDHRKLSQVAVDRLLHIIDHGFGTGTVMHTFIPPTLMLRDSVAHRDSL